MKKLFEVRKIYSSLKVSKRSPKKNRPQRNTCNTISQCPPDGSNRSTHTCTSPVSWLRLARSRLAFRLTSFSALTTPPAHTHIQRNNQISVFNCISHAGW